MGTTYSQRFYSALGFMLAGITAGICVVLYDVLLSFRNVQNKMLLILVLYLITPGLLGGMSGFVIGGDILNPNKVKNGGQAALRGLAVSLASWLVYAIIMSVVASRESNASFISMLLLLLIVGSIVVGWFMALLGVSTGLLLYRLRESRRAAREV